MTAIRNGSPQRVHGLIPNFLIGFIAAPLAGSFVTGLVSMLMLAPWRLGLGPWRLQVMTERFVDRIAALALLAYLVSIAAFIIAAIYTIVLGGLAVRRYRRRGRVPSVATAIGCGLLMGIPPFLVFPVLMGTLSEVTRSDGPGPALTASTLLVVAATASVATAWTFWRCGFAGRPEAGQ